MDNELYNAEQVAEHFGITIYTVRDWVKRGLLHGFKAGRDWRFTKQDIANCQAALQALTQERQSYTSTRVREEKQASSTTTVLTETPVEAPAEAKFDVDILTNVVVDTIIKENAAIMNILTEAQRAEFTTLAKESTREALQDFIEQVQAGQQEA